MNRRMLISLVGVLLALAGCTHNEHRATEASAYYDAQVDLQKAKLNQAQDEPCFQIKAAPGQTIKIEGVSEISANCDRAAPEVAGIIKPLPQYEEPFWGWLNTATKGAVSVFGWKIGADAAVDIADILTTNTGDRITDSYNSADTHISAEGDGAVAGTGNTVDQSSSSADTVDSYNGDHITGDGNDVGDNAGDNRDNSDSSVNGDCNASDGRCQSPDTIDNSDNSDNSNNSDNSQIPPDDETEIRDEDGVDFGPTPGG